MAVAQIDDPGLVDFWQRYEREPGSVLPSDQHVVALEAALARRRTQRLRRQAAEAAAWFRDLATVLLMVALSVGLGVLPHLLRHVGWLR